MSAQYEDYEWGLSKQEAKSQIEKKGHSIIKENKLDEDGEIKLFYKDKFFDKEIIVTFLFTPISCKLCSIRVASDDEDLGRDLKPILKEKYGEPIKKDKYEDNYAWMENGSPKLILDYNVETTLIYFSINYFETYQEEKKELQEKEAKDKF